MSKYFSELAQKTQAEREAKRALHEAGVNKKKEIMEKSVVLKAERQVTKKTRQFSFVRFVDERLF